MQLFYTKKLFYTKLEGFSEFFEGRRRRRIFKKVELAVLRRKGGTVKTDCFIESKKLLRQSMASSPERKPLQAAAAAAGNSNGAARKRPAADTTVHRKDTTANLYVTAGNFVDMAFLTACQIILLLL